VARSSKLCEADSLLADLRPGMSVALGGAVHTNRPADFVRALAKRGVGDLVLMSSPGSGWDADLLIACGQVAEAYLPMVTFGELGLAPSYRAAVERGEIKAHEFDAMSLVAAYLAGAYRHPFHLILSLEGTDIPKDPNLFLTVTDGQGGTFTAVRALRPDVCVLHVEEADEFGNCRHASGPINDVQLARASATTYLQAERIIPNAEIRKDPHRTTIEGRWIAGVVHAPYGAHPTATSFYTSDDPHLAAYHKAAAARVRGEPEAFERYLEQFVREPATPADYLDAIGGEDRMRELVAAHG
jgi:glutaconate CoA-transferase, subunit A